MSDIVIKIDQKTFRTIKQLTAVNDHGGAYLLAAQTLGLTSLAERFERINRQHLAHGHLPIDLYQERFVAYQELLESAQSQMSTADYQRFYHLF